VGAVVAVVAVEAVADTETKVHMEVAMTNQEQHHQVATEEVTVHNNLTEQQARVQTHSARRQHTVEDSKAMDNKEAARLRMASNTNHIRCIFTWKL